MGIAEPLLSLMNGYQRNFPRVPAPFAHIARTACLEEASVLGTYRAALTNGQISRIGAVLAPRCVGWSTLAAMRVPADRLDAVAGMVSAMPGVNHNYAREDAWNLWFVLAAADEAGARTRLDELSRRCACPVLVMPLHTGYHIDLGFDLARPFPQGPARKPARQTGMSWQQAMSPVEQRLLAALGEGLPLCRHPYAALGESLGLTEEAVLEAVNHWLAVGLIKRFGVVVHHRALGYTANAMCVWSVPAQQVDALGLELARRDGITLCYRREPVVPDWPYNLYAMIHGRCRDTVLALRAGHAAALGLDALPHKTLFSTHCYKQCGIRHGVGGTVPQ